MSDPEHGVEAHAGRIAALVDELESLEDSPAKLAALELVEHVDHLHRTCVWRLFEVLTALGGKGLVDRMLGDPAVKTLFVLYDLVPARPLTPVESNARVTGAHAGGFVPLSEVQGLEVEPTWRVAFSREDLPPGTLHAVEIDRTPVLLAAGESDVYALRNACVGSILPLHLGTLVGHELHCPWHGCRYDVRTGEKIGSPDQRLESFRARVDGDRIHVAARS